MNAAIMESPSEWSKEEKKEKTQMMNRIVERHSATSIGSTEKAVTSSTTSGIGKENSGNIKSFFKPIGSKETKI